MSEPRERYEVGSQAQPGELFALQLTRLELVSLNRALNNRIAMLRRSRAKNNPAPGSELAETLDQATEIAAGLLRRVDELLGIV